jgi:AraC-like DNA-binding protein
MLKPLIGIPAAAPAAGDGACSDLLSGVLRSIRVSGSVQFCFMPGGTWQTDGRPNLSSFAGGAAMPFHILVAGTCWLEMEGRRLDLQPGDVVAFPLATAHRLGAGAGGREIVPVRDLPPRPWHRVPVLRYGDARPGVRLLCGYLRCDTLDFRPLRNALPRLLFARTAEAPDAGWLGAAIAQMVSEVERPHSGGLSMLERLTEIVFIELLRHQVSAARAGSVGWLAALADRPLGRCLALIHDDPRRAWSVQDLAEACGLSRSTLCERFESVLATSPMRYVRDWRLCLASLALSTTARPIAAVAHEAGYGTEAAFNRAFSRAFGMPPAAWRQNARHA